MGKQTITIDVPKGKRAVWDEEKQQIIFKNSNSFDDIKSFEDACKVLDLMPYAVLCESFDEQEIAARKLKVIIEALNGEHKFNLFKDKVYFPNIQIVNTLGAVPSGKYDETTGYIATHKFTYDGNTYILVGGDVDSSISGLTGYHTGANVGYCQSDIGLFACKDKYIATYVSLHFADLIFLACFGHLGEFELIEIPKEKEE